MHSWRHFRISCTLAVFASECFTFMADMVKYLFGACLFSTNISRPLWSSIDKWAHPNKQGAHISNWRCRVVEQTRARTIQITDSQVLRTVSNLNPSIFPNQTVQMRSSVHDDNWDIRYCHLIRRKVIRCARLVSAAFHSRTCMPHQISANRKENNVRRDDAAQHFNC